MSGLISSHWDDPDFVQRAVTALEGASTPQDHGSLSGLTDDDHTDYYNSSRISTWLASKTTSDLTAATDARYLPTIQSHLDDATSSWTCVSTDDINTALDHLGGKINSILSILETATINLSS